LTEIHESSDENDINVEKSRNATRFLHNSVNTDQNQRDPVGDDGTSQGQFQYQAKSKKESVIKCFVPTMKEPIGAVPRSNQLKLKNVEADQPEVNNSVPWAQVKLRKRVEAAPDIPSDGKTDVFPAVQMSRKTTPFASEEPCNASRDEKPSEDAVVKNVFVASSAMAPSKTTIHGAIDGMFAAQPKAVSSGGSSNGRF
jgi:hypothetical protein